MSEISRRDFLKILGAGGAAAAGLPFIGRKPSRAKVEKVVSQLVPAEDIVPGIPQWYATTCQECPAHCGLLAKVREGRVIKIEGNPDHPISQGRHCMRGEAALQGLYNPDRLPTPLLRNPEGDLVAVEWDQALQALIQVLQKTLPSKVAWLTPPLTGSMEALIQQWSQALGGVKVVPYEPFSQEAVLDAAEALFGTREIPWPDFEKADLVIAFATDFLETWLSPVEFTRAYAARRADAKNRLHHIQVEARLSMTGSRADRWLSPNPGTEPLIAGLLLREILESGTLSSTIPASLMEWAEQFDRQSVLQQSGISSEEFESLKKAVLEAKRPLILGGNPNAGDEFQTIGWIAALALTALKGGEQAPITWPGKTPWNRAVPFRELKAFVEGWGEETEVLLVLDRNPLYSFPSFLNASEARKRLKFLAVFTPYPSETVEAADVVFPIRQFLEDWGDAEPREGIYSIQQPSMQPVPHFQSRAFGDVLIQIGQALNLKLPESFVDHLKARWQAIQKQVGDSRPFDEFWREVLQRGGLFVEPPRKTISLQPKSLPKIPRYPDASGPRLVIYPSLRHYDGRMANRPWIQEVPDPLNKVSWQSVLEVHPDDAQAWKLRDGDVVRISTSGGAVEVPVRTYPRIRRGTMALATGQGHTAFGRYATGQGVNAFQLLSPIPGLATLQWTGLPVQIQKTGKRIHLAHTDGAETLEGRKVAQTIPVGVYREREGELEPTYEEEFEKEYPATAAFYREYHKERFPEHESPYHWGLVVDTEKCVGCGACVVACMAENNIPAVGEKLIVQGREMFWIRIERYFDEQSHTVHFIPMMCQQCDNAPCEPVCPVFATVHSADGLNEQVYNRCVGTRYCSNNCPYKVRRFNWYTVHFPEPLNWQLNPDVTVREKGIMEKCTFCIQRIKFAKDRAKDENRMVRDGEIQPACVQACPAEALVFGNTKDPNSRVAKLFRDPRRYRVLEHLNTQPSVTYLKRFTEVNEG